MTYATKVHMTVRFGEPVLIQLTNLGDVSTGAIVDDVLQTALDDASSEIDGYVGGRIPLPLNPIPPMLVGACCDIARYKLLVNVDEEHPATLRYRDAIRLLSNIAKGIVSLGATAPAQVGGVVVVSSAPRRFSRETLE